MEIRLLTQGDKKIVSIEKLKEIKTENNYYLIQGEDRDERTIDLGLYREPHYSNQVILYIINEFNKDPNKIIRIPEDDGDVEKLCEEVTELEKQAPAQDEFYGDNINGECTQEQLEDLVNGGSN